MDTVMRNRLLPRRVERVKEKLDVLYPGGGPLILQRLVATLGRYGTGVPDFPEGGGLWSERDAVLIAYGDSVLPEAGAPLAALTRFATDRLSGAFSHVHVLPFFPWSSDDGFSVVDYRAVDPALGGWGEIDELASRFGLMLDLVLNHCSSQSGWFRHFLTGVQPAMDYFMTASPEDDLSAVVRPRTSPLLTKFRTRRGVRHVWTTFSPDQVDLDWRNPDVFFEFLDILLKYVRHGARIVRLDAVAFAWKEIGTPCIHHPNTHLLVKVLRDVLDIVSPGTVVLTETNVPHAENVSYFGDGDEAHMVYNFALPPLVLHALETGDGTYLTSWARDLETPPSGCTFLNFTASHDGVGLRPAQGILPDEAVGALVDAVVARGGRVSMRTGPDGGQVPYELNATWYSALSGGVDEERDMARFLCSQAIPLSLQGVPAVYIHSLFAGRNDHEGFAKARANRSLNRRKIPESELSRLDDPSSREHAAFHGLTRMLAVRRVQPAMHPEAFQLVHDFGAGVFAVERRSANAGQKILCLHNLTGDAVDVDLAGSEWVEGERFDLLREQGVGVEGGRVALRPCEVRWLV